MCDMEMLFPAGGNGSNNHSRSLTPLSLDDALDLTEQTGAAPAPSCSWEPSPSDPALASSTFNAPIAACPAAGLAAHGGSTAGRAASSLGGAAPSSEGASSNIAMLSDLKKAGGANLFGEVASIFGNWDPKSKTGDVHHPEMDMDGAIARIKEMVKEVVSSYKLKAKGKGGKAEEMWRFSASPHAAFGKTLDDMYTAFLMWAREDVSSPRPGLSNDLRSDGIINVTKAFRRLESYAKWMEEHRELLTTVPLNSDTVRTVIATWGCKVSYADDGMALVCVDLPSVEWKSFRESFKNHETLMRAVTWLIHAAIYDANSQLNGMALLYNVNCIGFGEALSLMPISTVLKLESLTVGVVPVRVRSFVILDSPPWVSAILRVFSAMVSKKVRKRIVTLKKDWGVPAERFGVGAIPYSFGGGRCGGTFKGNMLPLHLLQVYAYVHAYMHLCMWMHLYVCIHSIGSSIVYGQLIRALDHACTMHDRACAMYECACTMHECACAMHDCACTMHDCACTMYTRVHGVMYHAQS